MPVQPFDQREGRIANIGAAVLTGGPPQRAGDAGGRPVIGADPAATRIASLLFRFFQDVVLVGGRPPASAPGRRVPDPEGPACPLCGLVGALEATRAGSVLVVADDLPFVTPELLLALVAWPPADVVVPRTGGRLHPLCALYRCDSVLPVARQNLAAGRLALRALLDEVEIGVLDDADLAELDPTGAALARLNDPEDRRRVAERLGRR